MIDLNNNVLVINSQNLPRQYKPSELIKKPGTHCSFTEPYEIKRRNELKQNKLQKK